MIKKNNKTAIHMVSARASDNGIVPGQIKTDAESNEITAIPELIKTLEIEDCIVTIDAMGCQKNIAETIVDKGAEYILALKGNQSKLHDDAELFTSAVLKMTQNSSAMQFAATGE